MTDMPTKELKDCEAWLCYAWGETDVPTARFAFNADDIRQFAIEEWLGSDDDPQLFDFMSDWQSQDWRDGCLEYTFEIGGIRVEKVFAMIQTSSTPAAPMGDVAAIIEELRDGIKWQPNISQNEIALRENAANLLLSLSAQVEQMKAERQEK